MADYLHGAYGAIQTAGEKVTAKSRNAVVYVGTAPVHTLPGGGKNVNKPVLVNDMAEARKLFGYSDEWDKYTLCEAMHAHFENKAVGPLVLINVLNPATHKEEAQEEQSLTPENNKITIANAQDAVLDTVSIDEKTKGEDFAVQYDARKQTLTIVGLKPEGLGVEALTVKYDKIKPSAVKDTDVIGTSDGKGLNTGLQAIASVYPLTGYVPSFLLAPGFSCLPKVHDAMVKASEKVNGHWDTYILADIPIVEEVSTKVTIDQAASWKTKHGYDKPNETVYYPLAKGTDGHIYHISVLAAANMQELLLAQDGVPYKTASNTDCPVIASLYMGAEAENEGRVIDDYIVNNLLNKNGIASAAYVGGRWAIWGCHSADYSQENGDHLNVSETNRMMLYYISNDFQSRRVRNVDKPLTANDLKTIVAEEQTRLDALVKIGALTYGSVRMNAEADDHSDIINGDYSFTFDVTTTPLAKSMTAVVNWTDIGFVTYFSYVG